MLADFTITIHAEEEGGRNRQVQVKVHDDVKSLRSACTRYSNQFFNPRHRRYDGEFSDTLGICHRFHMMNKDLVAIVRLAPPNLGAGIVAHEMAHAAVWINEIENEFKEPLDCGNDERFCWILGELVRHTTDKLYEHGIYS